MPKLWPTCCTSEDKIVFKTAYDSREKPPNFFPETHVINPSLLSRDAPVSFTITCLSQAEDT